MTLLSDQKSSFSHPIATACEPGGLVESPASEATAKLRDASSGPATRARFRAPARLLGTSRAVQFVSTRAAACVVDEFVRVDPSQHEYLNFTFPNLTAMHIPPYTSAYPIAAGSSYEVSGFFDSKEGSNVQASLIYFDQRRRLAHENFRLANGPFSFRSRAPAQAQKVAIALRAAGGSAFTLKKLAVVRKNAGEKTVAPSDRSVVMMVLNDIVHDNRVIKTVNSLEAEGYQVSLFGISRSREKSPKTIEIANTKAILFPDPKLFLPRGTLLADRWDLTIAHLRAVVWPYVEDLNPRFIHTHDYHTVPLGLCFMQRLRDNGRTVSWLHDVHDYVRGYDHMEPEMQELFLKYEAEAIRHMDQRLTVSPLIVEWLVQEYQLSEPPTIVMNAPCKSSFPTDFERSIRGDVGLAPDVPLIVYTGGVQEMKGIHTVVSALAHNPRWHFAVVTAQVGPYIDYLKSVAREGDCLDRLHFVPYVAPHEVPAYVRDASIGIIPFRRYGNGDASLPNKLFDYLHAELPVVTSDCTHMKEFVERWQIGQVFVAEDVGDCKRAIEEAMKRLPEYRQNLRSQPQLLQECTWEEQSKHLLAAYRRMAESSPLPAKRDYRRV